MKKKQNHEAKSLATSAMLPICKIVLTCCCLLFSPVHWNDVSGFWQFHLKLQQEQNSYMDLVLILVKVETVFYRCSIIQGVISLSVVRSCGLSSCVCDCTKIHHRWQKDHQLLLQCHCKRDALSGHLSSSEQRKKVCKAKKLELISSASLLASADAAAEKMAMFTLLS